MTGLVVFAHGSRVAEANESVEAVAAALANAGGFEHVEPAFLELGTPDLAGAVERLISSGVDEIIVLPYFLTLGTHLRRDLPRIVDGLRSIYKGVAIHVTEPLEGHPALVEVLLDRAKEALDGGGGSEGQAD
jgi:sirohydrochlorin ferrochelatase